MNECIACDWIKEYACKQTSWSDFEFVFVVFLWVEINWQTNNAGQEWNVCIEEYQANKSVKPVANVINICKQVECDVEKHSKPRWHIDSWIMINVESKDI